CLNGEISMIKQLFSFFLTATMASVISAREDAPVVASVPVTHSSGYHTSVPGIKPMQKLYLMPMHLTAQQLQSIKNVVHSVKPFQAVALSSRPASRQNGMKGVPVLDQGMHGSC